MADLVKQDDRDTFLRMSCFSLVLKQNKYLKIPASAYSLLQELLGSVKCGGWGEMFKLDGYGCEPRQAPKAHWKREGGGTENKAVTESNSMKRKTFS